LFVGLPPKWLCSKKFYNFKMLSTFVTIDGLLLESLEECSSSYMARLSNNCSLHFPNNECLCSKLVLRPLVPKWCIALCNNNVFEIDGKNWNLTNLNQFDKWWFWGFYQLFLLTSNIKNEVFGVFRILPFHFKEVWSKKKPITYYLWCL
jgi:hypothetical protein